MRVPRPLKVAASAMLVVAVTSGCKVPVFGYPTHLATAQSHRIEDFWKWTWVAALVVGAFTLVLILWAPLAYRRRDHSVPQQVRYNMPIEILYTIVPLVIVGGLFYYTVVEENYLDKKLSPAAFSAAHGLTVDVTGFQWNWKFGYEGITAADGNDLTLVGSPQQGANLVLPEGRPVRFVVSAEDVIHSFRVPAFAYKRDAIPGRQSEFEVTPDRPGVYVGRCAELCGVYHDRMNFTVTVMPAAQYDKRVSELAAAQTGASS